ncbi:MAG: Asp-tRNA(Asn)/Glu-tRNA(Gln) amidotransferase subunit GatC [bacterium]|nr:Asp-tRNA(Asn)/Glu-tRNA(Gln) amidotransferase subunit GatC [bacterium]
MVSPEDIKKLANLARIKVSEEELPKLSKDIESILGYVSELEKVEVVEGEKQKEGLRNVMREDALAHESGKYTENILINAPRRQGDYVVVKKIL